MLGLFEAGSYRRAYLLKDCFARPGQGVSSRLDELTPREREVLAAIAQSKTNSLIAEELFLTTQTVEENVNAIF